MNTNTHERRLWWRHLLSFLIAPITMTLVIPAVIVAVAGVPVPTLDSATSIALVTVGGLLVVAGLGLLVWTVALFDRVGEGTLGVGDVLGEPVKLVIEGPYRHVRNPMISGVLCILLGEVAISASGWLLLWFAIFGGLQAAVIRWWEEPHLERRYGHDYVEYRRNVRAWLPRVSVWP